MKKMRPLKYFIVTASAVALSACASWLGGEEIKVTPVSKMSGLTTESRDPLYESAVNAINERDYGRALDYLQEFKARNPGNIKALNALGVVYDKLGRFDLSARYYAQARAVDPNSRVVAANVNYSKALQGLTDSRGPVAQLDLPENLNPDPAGKPTVLASDPAADVAAPRPVAAAIRPVATPVILARTEIAENVKPNQRLIEAGAVSTREPKNLALEVPQLAVVQTEESPNAGIPALPVAAAKPAAGESTIAVPAPTASKLAEAPQADPISKPHVSVAVSPSIHKPAAPALIRRADASKSGVVAPAAPVAAKPPERPRLAQASANPAAAAQPPSRQAAILSAKKRVFIIGQPVRIMNASGRPGRIGTVSHRLSALGWTVRLAEAGRTQPVTTLVYSTRNIGAAKAMQRTLPFPVRLVAESGPTGMRLVIGRDYLSWKSKNVRMHALWQKGPTVASLQTQSAKGVR